MLRSMLRFLLFIQTAMIFCSDAVQAYSCHDLFSSRRFYSDRFAAVIQHPDIRAWFNQLDSSKSVKFVDSAKKFDANLADHLFWYDGSRVLIETNSYRIRKIASQNGAPEQLVRLISPDWTIGLATHESLHAFEQSSWRSLRFPTGVQHANGPYDPSARTRLNKKLIDQSHRIEQLLAPHFDGSRGTRAAPLISDATLQRLVGDIQSFLREEKVSWSQVQSVAIRESTAHFVEVMAIARTAKEYSAPLAHDGSLIADAYLKHRERLGFMRDHHVNESSIYMGYGFGADLIFLAGARGADQAKLANIFRESSDPFDELLNLILKLP